MIGTAYLHPDFAEELALLPSALKIQFYTKALSQSDKAPLTQPLERYFPHAADPAMSHVYTQFYYLGYGPKFLFSLNTKIMPASFVYLHLAQGLDDDAHCRIVRKRMDDLKEGRTDLVELNEFLCGLGDDREYREALKINSDLARHAINDYLLDEVFREAKEEAAAIFNLCAPQMDRLLMRFDYFLSVLQERLRNRGAAAAIEINFKGAEPKLLYSFREFYKKPIKKADFD